MPRRKVKKMGKQDTSKKCKLDLIEVTFDKSVFELLRDLLKYPRKLNCFYCKVKITHNNIGGFLPVKKVICKSDMCLCHYVMDDARRSG